MRTVLVTGSEGLVGRSVVTRLGGEEWEVRGFDIVDGVDLRDEAAVSDAVAGCDSVVHAGALAHDSRGTPAEVVATNLLGTWHVLLAAERHAIRRVVYFSSGQVFGFAEGEGEPAYTPVDDDHPLRAARPYGMSKRLAEEMCEAWSSRTLIPTVVLRPVMIVNDETASRMTPDVADMGAFVHVDDVADAVAKSLTVDIDHHVRMTLCGPGDFDTSVAETVLGWHPQLRTYFDSGSPIPPDENPAAR